MVLITQNDGGVIAESLREERDPERVSFSRAHETINILVAIEDQDMCGVDVFEE